MYILYVVTIMNQSLCLTRSDITKMNIAPHSQYVTGGGGGHYTGYNLKKLQIRNLPWEL